MFAFLCSDSSTLSPRATVVEPIVKLGSDCRSTVFSTSFAVNVNLICAPLELAINENAVDDHERAVIVCFDVGMVPRRARVVEHDMIVRRAPNRVGRARVQLCLGLASAGVGNFQKGHRRLRSKGGAMILQGKPRFSLATRDSEWCPNFEV